MASNPRLDLSLDDLIKKSKKKPAAAAKKPAQAAKSGPASKGKAGQQQQQKPGSKGKTIQQQKPVQKQGLQARGGIHKQQKAGGGAARPAAKVGCVFSLRLVA
jgi:hypothetical protein